MRITVLIGGGGHALSLMEAFDDDGIFAGYLSPSEAPEMTIPWLGNDTDATNLIEKGMAFHVAFVYAGLPVMDKRRCLIEYYKSLGADFTNIISTNAVLTPHTSVGRGVAVLNGAIINRASVADHVVVNTGAIIEHDCRIGENTFIGPGVVMGGNVTIGEDCFIGLGAKIRNGVSIAPGVTVGMGAIVTRNLTEPGIYHGNPLRLHKTKSLL